jgi:hypothetical protein
MMIIIIKLAAFEKNHMWPMYTGFTVLLVIFQRFRGETIIFSTRTLFNAVKIIFRQTELITVAGRAV